MINKTSIILNLIIYIVLLCPSVFFLIYNKKKLSDKSTVLNSIAVLFILNSILSSILYIFSYNIFSLFTSKTGTVNLCVFISRIVFLDSSLYSLKVLLPAYFMRKNKKAVILILLKITATVLFSILGYALFSFVGLLYSFPITDTIYYIVLIIIFIKY